MPDERQCRVCGCTEVNAEGQTCAWIEANLCSACAPEEVLAEALGLGDAFTEWVETRGNQVDPENIGEFAAFFFRRGMEIGRALACPATGPELERIALPVKSKLILPGEES